MIATLLFSAALAGPNWAMVGDAAGLVDRRRAAARRTATPALLSTFVSWPVPPRAGGCWRSSKERGVFLPAQARAPAHLILRYLLNW